MDIQHISAWMEMLSALGFSSTLGRQLLWHACLGQKEFIIKEHLQFGADTMIYQLHFKADTVSKRLTCAHYDATLRKEVALPDAVVNGIDVQSLEKSMSRVNWQIPYSDSSDFKLADQDTWMPEATIEAIISDLEVLTITAEGSALANVLKYKFWTDSDLRNLIPESPALRNQYEIGQRFYVMDRDGITASEAYRFLNNRWMERKMHASNRLLRQNGTEPTEVKTITKESSDKKKSRQSKKNVE